MEFRQIRYFIAVAEEKNFAHAAHKLNVSQPPVTRQIQKLEAELGVTLFRRTSKGSEPTEAGQVFLAEARDIVASLDRAGEKVAAAHRGELGALRIGYFGSVSYSFLPRLFRAFKERHPNIELALYRRSKAAQIVGLKRGELHVGFGRYFPEEPRLVCEEIAHEGVSLCLPDTFRGSYESTNWQDVFDHLPLILFPADGRPNFADEALAMLKREGVSPKIAAIAEDGRAALMQVAVGTGACLAPHSMVEMNWFGVRAIRPTAFRRDCPISIVYRRADTSPVLRRFVQAMRDLPAISLDNA